MSQSLLNAAWVPDLGDGTYQNPVLYADYSDPDVVRVGEDYYLVASSFTCMPGVPVLHSRDLVNWKLINYVYERFPLAEYDRPQHGRGAWAPSIRYHAGKFWVFFSSPDEGIWMSTADNPAGKWSPLHLVRAAKGWIDPCPFWDRDGQAYLVHAFARSRAGIKDRLQICKMSTDGKVLLDDGKLVFDGEVNHPTIEGPKLYQRGQYYYIFAPAGGVPQGWQTVLRSEHIYGPYEDRIVMARGKTSINGPHQGGWVDTPAGEDWFLHFQDQDAYGRVVHLQPLRWQDDWPVIGEDEDGDEVGQPLLRSRKPAVGNSGEITNPQTSDDFTGSTLGLQWQWQANPRSDWVQFDGGLRLFSQPVDECDLLKAGNVLLQKFPAPAFVATTRVSFCPLAKGERAGLVVMGKAYAGIGLEFDGSQVNLVQFTHPETGSEFGHAQTLPVGVSEFWLKVRVSSGARCQFSYSLDGSAYTGLGEEFAAVPGVWIGAKVGLFAVYPDTSETPGGYLNAAAFNSSRNDGK